MEIENHTQTNETPAVQAAGLAGRNYIFPSSLVIAIAIVAGAWIYTNGYSRQDAPLNNAEVAKLEKQVLPADGVELPVKWGDLGKRMIDAGVIDQTKFEELYAQRGGIDEKTTRLLNQSDNGKIVINQENAGTLLNLLWALGLGNKNEILEKGPMTDKTYGGDASRFASTGGWSLARGQIMDHYSMHKFMSLTPEQQALVESTSKGIYRSCCNNSTYFPDCNHGMAMLGLLELMASQGVKEDEMYKVALKVNAYWFPDTYLTIAKYLKAQNQSWDKADPKVLLGESYSSASGYRKILSEVEPVKRSNGGSCGV
ncbi:MAG: hypothetical protein AAB561_00605 [Patescibacteria group bacterium]